MAVFGSTVWKALWAHLGVGKRGHQTDNVIISETQWRRRTVMLQRLKNSHSTTGSAEGNKKHTKPVIFVMEGWRKMLRAIQNSSTVLLMLVAQTRIHYSTVQEDILNICVNTGSGSVRSFVRYFKVGCLTEICEWKQNNVRAVFVTCSWILF